MEVLGYLRVSTDRQETLRQDNGIRAWCKLNAASYQLEILHEPDVSGRSRAVRRGPAQALRYYEKLVTEDWDRLERPTSSIPKIPTL